MFGRKFVSLVHASSHNRDRIPVHVQCSMYAQRFLRSSSVMQKYRGEGDRWVMEEGHGHQTDCRLS
jgi:hypothetical protein